LREFFKRQQTLVVNVILQIVLEFGFGPKIWPSLKSIRTILQFKTASLYFRP